MSSCLLFAYSLDGHNATYVRLIAAGLVARGADVTLCCSRRSTSQEAFDRTISAITTATGPGSIQINDSLPDQSKRSFYRRKLLHAQWLASEMARLRPNHVYLPSGDAMSLPLLLKLRHFSQAGRPGIYPVIHSCPFGYKNLPLAKRLRRFIELFALRLFPYRRIFFVDDLSYRTCKRLLPGFHRLTHLPDPIELSDDLPKSEARKLLDLPGNGLIFGCLGYLNARKGVPQVLAGFAEAAGSLPSDCRLLLLGQASAQVQELLGMDPYAKLLAQGTIQFRNRYLTPEELTIAVQACDGVNAVYSNHVGIASFAIRALCLRRPIIACADGWIGALARTHSLMMVPDPGGPRQFAATLIDFFDAPTLPDGVSRQMRELHSVESFQKVLLRDLLE